MKNTELQFGISLSGGVKEYINALKIIDVSLFDLVELPGAYLDERKKPGKMEDNGNDIFATFKADKRNFQITSISDIAPANISSEMAEQSKNIINDYIENIRSKILEIDRLGIKQCSLNISPENDFDHEEVREKKVQLLKKINPFLFHSDMQLSLPVRIPAAIGIDFTHYPAFIRENMSPNIKLAINVHPHELKNGQQPAEILRSFRFLMSSISFIYEPDAGNFLVDQLLEPWLSALEEINFTQPVFFGPRTANIATFSREVERISTLLKEYQKKRNTPQT